MFKKLFGLAFVLAIVETFAADKPANTGKIPTKREGLSAANTFRIEKNKGYTFLRVTAGTTETKVKIIPKGTQDGLELAPREIVVKEATKVIGPFPTGVYNDEEECVNFALSATTSVVVEAFALV